MNENVHINRTLTEHYYMFVLYLSSIAVSKSTCNSYIECWISAIESYRLQSISHELWINLQELFAASSLQSIVFSKIKIGYADDVFSVAYLCVVHGTQQ